MGSPGPPIHTGTGRGRQAKPLSFGGLYKIKENARKLGALLDDVFLLVKTFSQQIKKCYVPTLFKNPGYATS